jgi:hypothetical protein
MSGFKTHKLDIDFRLEIGSPWEIPEEIRKHVADIWRLEEESRGDSLTDGHIFHLSEHRPDYLRIQPSKYRYLIARRRAPELVGAGLNISPLGVTGVLLCKDGIVLGRRGKNVATDAGLWEPSPAGGLSLPDPKAQILEEFEEELGLPASQIVSAEPRGLVEDQESGVFDIVFRLLTPASFQEVQDSQSRRGTDEYSELTVITPLEIGAFLEENANQVLPALVSMLRVAAFL